MPGKGDKDRGTMHRLFHCRFRCDQPTASGQVSMLPSATLQPPCIVQVELSLFRPHFSIHTRWYATCLSLITRVSSACYGRLALPPTWDDTVGCLTDDSSVFMWWPTMTSSGADESAHHAHNCVLSCQIWPGVDSQLLVKFTQTACSLIPLS